MKIVTISDTHGGHEEVQLPPGDILIHAGDVSDRGEAHEVSSFLDWFGSQDFLYKIFIAGNHDFFFEREPGAIIEKVIPPGVIYLNDSGITVEGIKIWGSPVTPWFMNWAFNRRRGAEIKKHWDLIPEDTDLLITHGPMFRVLDQNFEGTHLGCKDLFARVQEVKPKVHVFGHFHESYGMLDRFGTKFINASTMNAEYIITNAPISFDWESTK